MGNEKTNFSDSVTVKLYDSQGRLKEVGGERKGKVERWVKKMWEILK